MEDKIINGKKYSWENISINISGVEIQGIKSIHYDEFKEVVEYAKSKGIKLNYGASTNFPLSIEYDKGTIIDELLMIDLKNVPRDSWFKF
jgi:hypothetical protein